MPCLISEDETIEVEITGDGFGNNSAWVHVTHPTEGHEIQIHVIMGKDGIIIDVWNQAPERMGGRNGFGIVPEGPVASMGLEWNDELSKGE